MYVDEYVKFVLIDLVYAAFGVAGERTLDLNGHTMCREIKWFICDYRTSFDVVSTCSEFTGYMV